MPNPRSTVLAAVPLLACALSAHALAAQETERYSLSGNAVAIYNLAGTVRIEAGSGSGVVVEVRRGGDDAGQLKVERREVGGKAALVVRYPDGEDVVYSPGRWHGETNMNVRSDGTFYGEGSRGDRVRIHSSGRGTEAWADLRILVPAGKAVDVRLGVGDVNAAGVTGDLDVDVGAAAVETSRTRGKLRLDTGSGSVTVADAQGDLTVDTGSGAVRINGVRGESVRVDTGSGSVSADGVTAGSVFVDTGSGRIALGAVAARELELDTGSGGVDVALTTDVDRLHIDTGSGSVRLSVPKELGAAFTADTGSGGISCDIPITITHRERDQLVGRIGDGKGSIEIETGSGSVHVSGR